jgi:hypothetical protein
MKELTVSTLLAVFEEMFGFWLFWGLAALAVVVALAFLGVLMRERRIAAGRLLFAELIGIGGGIAAVWFVLFITSSGLSDIGGPIDVIVVLGIWLAGAIGALIAFYALAGLIVRHPKPRV